MQNRTCWCDSSTGFHFPGIGVERHTPVFQTGIEGALPSCPSISQVNLVCRRRPRTVEGAGARPPCRAADSVRLGFPLRDANTGAGQDFTDLAAAVQLRVRVAFGSQTLTVKLRLLPGWNTVRVRGDPPFRRCGAVVTQKVLQTASKPPHVNAGFPLGFIFNVARHKT